MGSRYSYVDNETVCIAITSEINQLWDEFRILAKQKMNLPNGICKAELVRIAIDIATNEYKKDVINTYKKRYATQQGA